MKKLLLLLLVVVVVLLLGGCHLIFSDLHQIELYVSIGSGSALPPSRDVLADYWGKTVHFSAWGVDTGVNDTIVLAGTADMNWTGSDQDSGTQYAKYDFDLETGSKVYPGGKFKFQIYIDWDDSGALDAGDIYMLNYSIISDQDNDPSTAGISESTTLYPEIIYDTADSSITIDDPLTNGSGFQWIIDSVHEGDLAVKP